MPDLGRRALAAGRTRLQPAALGLARRALAPRTVAAFEYEVRPRPRYGWGAPANPALMSVLGAREGEAEAMVAAVTSLTADLLAIPGGRASPAGELAWDNDWWGGLDAVALYTALRNRRPRHYIEIGSGHSTRFARRAIDDHGLATRITSIDPQPRAGIDELCDTVVRVPLEQADTAVFDQLGDGDILVVDGSHTAFMGSDTVVAFLEVLPALAPGVLVAIDDIFLPWDYPATWDERWYGEQYLLAGLLLGGAAGWAVRFPAWYLTQESEAKERFDPVWRYLAPVHGRYAMSFWMEKVAGTD